MPKGPGTYGSKVGRPKKKKIMGFAGGGLKKKKKVPAYGGGGLNKKRKKKS
tara:strand:+ start:103 stop:255 length:153 start_codon:yes stop_codon:yes gene_type:complete